MTWSRTSQPHPGVFLGNPQKPWAPASNSFHVLTGCSSPARVRNVNFFYLFCCFLISLTVGPTTLLRTRRSHGTAVDGWIGLLPRILTGLTQTLAWKCTSIADPRCVFETAGTVSAEFHTLSVTPHTLPHVPLVGTTGSLGALEG